jgi:DNA-binding transcriptional LysR family regulator
MINPKCIEVFLSVVEHKSISAVAKNTFLSQPTVSEYLNQLEQLVGTTLVLRSKGQRQIGLTPAGEAFLPLAKKWMSHQQELENQILQFSHAQTHNTLRLAASSGAHQHVASHIICKLLAHRPDIHLQLCNVERREMAAAIERFSFDVAFLFGETTPNDAVKEIPLFKEDQYILCPANTPLPERSLTPEDLDPKYFVAYAAYRRSANFMDWYDRCFQDQPMTPMFEASSLASIHNYLNDPRCWTVVPASIAIADVAQRMDQLTYRQIAPAPPARICNILISRSYTEKSLLQAFLACCDSFIQERPYLHKI